jgi:hypothetical protein
VPVNTFAAHAKADIGAGPQVYADRTVVNRVDDIPPSSTPASR